MKNMYINRTDNVSASLIYSGRATPGTLTSEPKWQITRITVVGTEYITEYAIGVTENFVGDAFNYVWDDRATLTYK